MRYEIRETPHFKTNYYHLLDTADSLKEACRKARELALAKGMVSIFTDRMRESVGDAIRIDKRTVYLYRYEKGIDIFKRILIDGSLSSKVTEKGIAVADHTMRHWM